MSTGGVNLYLHRASIMVVAKSPADTAVFVVSPKEYLIGLLLDNR